MKTAKRIKIIIAALTISATLAQPVLLLAADEKEAKTEEIKGEVVDLMCYLDHGAKGEKHKGCAEGCIKGGGPVGLLSGDQVYLVVGDHKPLNAELASKAGQEVTLKGQIATRSGMKMIQKAELVK